MGYPMYMERCPLQLIAHALCLSAIKLIVQQYWDQHRKYRPK